MFGAHAHVAIARVHLAAGEPDRGEALLGPLLVAAERSGWREAIATTALVLGLCLEARGELDEAVALVARSAEIADESGIAAPAWEGHAALARMHRVADRPGEADEQLAMAEASVARVSAGVNADALRAAVRAQATT